MPRTAYRFVEKLTKLEIQKLQQARDTGETRRIRQRAHAILLSYEGTSVLEIARIFDANRNTVGIWLDRWDAEGLDGLSDKPRPGSPPKLDEREQEKALEMLKSSPQSSNAVLSRIKDETGKQISGATLKRIAKKAGLSWKRMRKSLRSKRDQKKFAAQA